MKRKITGKPRSFLFRVFKGEKVKAVGTFRCFNVSTFYVSTFLAFGLLFGPATALATSRIPKSVKLNNETPWTPTTSGCTDNCTSNNGGAVTVCKGDEITVMYTVEVSGGNWKSTKWKVESNGEGCDNFEPDYTSDGTYTETFVITAPDSAGTFDLTLHARSDDGCSSGTSGKLTLQDAITVRAKNPEVCDKVDNDCDGLIDEDLNCGNVCAGAADACLYIMMDRTGSTSASSRVKEAAAGKVVLDFFGSAAGAPPVGIGVFGCNGSGFPGGEACTRQGLSNTESPVPYGDNDGAADNDHYAFLDQGAASASSVGTHFVSALNKAGDELDHCDKPGRILVFLSDGGNNDNSATTINTANALKNDGVEIFTILFPGTSNPTQADVDEMKAIASDMDHFFNAPTADDLQSIFELIVEMIGCDDRNPCTVDRCDPATGCVHQDIECDNPCESGTCKACATARSGNGGIVEIKYVSANFNGTDTTFTYSLCQDPSSQDVSHIVIGMSELCCDKLKSPHKCDTDPTTGLFGVKFETPHGAPDCGENCGQPGDSYSFKLEGNVGTGCVDMASKVNGGDSVGLACVIGPSCEGCVLNCRDRQCGDDGCGGSCGSCGDNNTCTTDSCSAAGTCVHAPVDCNDHNACTNDRCDPASGCGHSTITCNDDKPCTDDSCDPATGCAYRNDNTNTCTDNNACTNDACVNGTCNSTTRVCNDEKPCTDDSCNPATGCVFKNDNNNTCGDENACTTDRCRDGVCVNDPNAACNDNNPCTDDRCDPAVGCVYAPDDSNTCNDGNACTENDRCSDGRCVGDEGPGPICNDNNPCTDDRCTAAGGCIYTPDNTNTCSDNNACTVDVCLDGTCSSTPRVCNDNNPCTDNSCDPASGCVYTNDNNNTCSDGVPCTVDRCANGTCSGTPRDCGDDNPCTDDSCNPDTGACVNRNDNSNTCTDHNPCTTDACVNGDCVGTPRVCNDNNTCTDDSCNPDNGECVYRPDNNNTCTDNNSCTTDLCVNGTCVSTSQACNDNNPCSDDSCDPASGCVYRNDNTNPCTDNSACTNDACVNGTCVSTPRVCNDNQPCTDDRCNPATGCVFTPDDTRCDDRKSCTSNRCDPVLGCVYDAVADGTTCNDNNPCTGNDVCRTGECAGADDCDDDNVCTSDRCDSVLGCVHDCADTEDPRPVGGCPPAQITAECGEPEPPFNPMFADNCDNDLERSAISGIAPGKCTGEFFISRSASAVDDCGNSATCSQTVAIVDSTGPRLTCPDNVVVACTSIEGVPVEDVNIQVSAEDDCSAVTLSDNRPQGSYPPSCGRAVPTVVTFTAQDDCGNRSTCNVRIEVVGGACCPASSDSELAILPAWVDLRQDHDGPVLTKAKFDMWNQNEVRFSGTERCITCWDQTLLGFYNAPNHFLMRNIHTDKGKARIDGVASQVVCDSADLFSVNTPLLAVLIKEVNFGNPVLDTVRSAITPVGIGEQAGRILFDVSAALQAPLVAGAIDTGLAPDVENADEEGQPTPDAGPFGGLPTMPLGPGNYGATPGDWSSAGTAVDTNASTTLKGSILVFPSVEVKWDAHGNVIQDSFIEITNDFSAAVRVQVYMVQGDPATPAVFGGDPPIRIERAHRGWNNVDAQFELTPNAPTYWSVLSGLPLGIQPWTVLDAGDPPGRPDVDPRNLGGRMLRGFIIAWAVNVDGEEINWNHLSGAATVIHYGNTSAWDYLPWSFPCVSGVARGSVCDATAGQLNLDGLEYGTAPEKLLFDFYATGSSALSLPGGR